MDKERARGIGANELLHRYAIETACAEQRQSYDFGLYQTEELKRFKSTLERGKSPYTPTTLRLPMAAAVQLARTGR